MRLCSRFSLALAGLLVTAALCRADGSGVVRVGNGNGSAAVIGHVGGKTYLLTAHHCCEYSDTLTIDCYPDTYTGRVVKRSKADDLALVVLDGAPAPAKLLRLAGKKAVAGPASLVSCPAGAEPCVRACMIGGEGYYDRVDSKPGSSGGAVVQGGNLVGIHTTAGTFVPLSKVRAFLAGEQAALLREEKGVPKAADAPANDPSTTAYPPPATYPPPAGTSVQYSGTFTKPGTYTYREGDVTIEIQIK